MAPPWPVPLLLLKDQKGHYATKCPKLRNDYDASSSEVRLEEQIAILLRVGD